MRKLLLTVLALAAFAPAYAWEQGAMNARIDQTNVIVNDHECSGTIIAPGYVLTADHCIMDQYKVVKQETYDKDGKVHVTEYRVPVPGVVLRPIYVGPTQVATKAIVFKIEAADRDADLALLKLQAPLDGTPAPIACKSLTRGDTVFAVGNPFGILYSSVTKGIVSSTQRSYRDLEISGQLGDMTDSGEHGLVQHSASIAPGNSGGALYNDAGELVGVNVRGIPGGFSFAVPLDDIRAFLTRELPKALGACPAKAVS